MRYKYKTVDTTTLKGLKYAEWLKAHGWTIILVSPFNITFEKIINKGKDNIK